MRFKKFLLLLAPMALMATTCTPGGYKVAPGISGSVKSVAFITPAGDNDLLFRVAAVVNEVNRFSGSTHYVTTSDPGPSVARSFVHRTDNAEAACGIAGAIGCNFLEASRASTGSLYAAGGTIYVMVPGGDSGWFNSVIAHEVGHALGLDHFDSTVKDSSGLVTAEVMCGGADSASQCGLADVVLQDGANFYAEGDIRGFQNLANAAVSVDAFNPIGAFDNVGISAGNVSVSGWTIDGGDVTGNEVHGYIYRTDGSIVVARNLGRAQLLRSDVGSTYPWAGAHHGYGASIGTVGSGTYDVCVYGINVGLGGNSSLGCKRITV